MATFLTLLEQAPLIIWLRGNLLGYVVLNAAHVLALGLFMGAVVSLDLGILKLPGFGWSATVAGPLRRMAIATLRIGISNGLVCEKPGKPDSALGGQPMPAWMAWNWRLGRCLVWIRPALTARLALVGP